MPIPTALEGKALVGSIWVRRIGDHAGYKQQVVSFNDNGVKVKGLTGQRGHGKTNAQSIQWPMFMNLYNLEYPDPLLDLVREGKELKITTDKEGLVLTATREANNGVVAEPEKVIQMRPCSGGWHHNAGPNRTDMLVPVTEFSPLVRGPNKGQLAKLCNYCRQRSLESSRKNRPVRGKIQLEPQERATLWKPVSVEPTITEVIAPSIPEVVTPPARGDLTRWKVTLIPAPVPVTIEVEAADYLDAGVAVGDGEVIRIEKIV